MSEVQAQTKTLEGLKAQTSQQNKINNTKNKTRKQNHIYILTLLLYTLILLLLLLLRRKKKIKIKNLEHYSIYNGQN